MKYCTKCGTELVDEAVVCPSCGTSQETAPKPQDASSFGFAFLGFCIPLVGLILWLVWKDSTPLKAKSAGKGALVGVIVSVVFYIAYAVLMGIMLASEM